MKSGTKNRLKGRVPLDFLQVSLYFAIASESLFFWTDFANAYTVPKVVAALIGAAVVLPQCCVKMLRGEKLSLSSPSYRLLALFGVQIAAMTWATVNSISPAVSFWGGDWRRMGWIAQFAMISVAMAVPVAIGHDFAKWKRLLRVIAVVGAIAAVYGLLQWIGWDPFVPAFMRDAILAQFGGRYRSPGTIGQSTYFANFLLYPFFASLALIAGEDGRTARAVSAIMMLFTGAAILFAAAARASILACGAGLGVFGLWVLLSRLRAIAAQRARKTWMWVVVIGAVAAAGLAAHFRPRLSNMGTDSEAISRIVVWQDVVKGVLPHIWLTGTGPGMFRVAYTRYRSPSYGLFGPDVHWETPHNLFLDRFTEQGMLGLLALLGMIAVFSFNIASAIRRSSDRKHSAAYAAFAGGGLAALASSFFNGEVIPTTYFLYLWLGLSAAAHECTKAPPAAARLKPHLGRQTARTAITGAAVTVSLCLLWYGYKNWQSEIFLQDARTAAHSGDEQQLLAAAGQAGDTLPQVGTYQLEFLELTDAYLGDNRNRLSEISRKRLAQTAIDAGVIAVMRTDKPMLALLHLISLGETASDSRTAAWVAELKQMDPYWFRPHELSARLLLRQRKIDEALREATIAHELAPYVESSTILWRQLTTVRREFGPAFR